MNKMLNFQTKIHIFVSKSRFTPDDPTSPFRRPENDSKRMHEDEDRSARGSRAEIALERWIFHS